eukprot:IDg15841t1
MLLNLCITARRYALIRQTVVIASTYCVSAMPVAQFGSLRACLDCPSELDKLSRCFSR